MLYNAGVRIPLLVATLIAGACLAGCDGGSGGGGDDAVWAGPAEPAEDGTVAVDGFAEHQGEVDEPWEGSAEMAAAEFLRLDEQTASRTTIAGVSSPEGNGPTTVTVTLDGLFDDSVGAERWTLGFDPDGKTYVLTAAQWAQRCQPGRGHQAFTPEPCI